jgi:hypothetical protein
MTNGTGAGVEHAHDVVHLNEDVQKRIRRLSEMTGIPVSFILERTVDPWVNERLMEDGKVAELIKRHTTDALAPEPKVEAARSVFDPVTDRHHDAPGNLED